MDGLVVDVDRETVKASPEYDPASPPGPEEEARLHEHYGHVCKRRLSPTFWLS